jgi:hypothetical protein
MIKKLAILSSALGLLVAGGLQADVGATYDGKIAAATSNMAPGADAAGSSSDFQPPPFPGGPMAAPAAGSEAAGSSSDFQPPPFPGGPAAASDTATHNKAAGPSGAAAAPSGAAASSTHPKKSSK